jgi:hypothetical protein
MGWLELEVEWRRGGLGWEGDGEAPGQHEAGAVPVLRGLSNQQDVWQHQARQRGCHAHGQPVGSMMHKHRAPTICHLVWSGSRAGTNPFSNMPPAPPD